MLYVFKYDTEFKKITDKKYETQKDEKLDFQKNK